MEEVARRLAKTEIADLPCHTDLLKATGVVQVKPEPCGDMAPGQ